MNRYKQERIFRECRDPNIIHYLIVMQKNIQYFD